MKTIFQILLIVVAAGLVLSDAGCRRIRPPAPASQPSAKTKPAATTKAVAASKPAPKLLEYKIRQGDTLRKIAMRECGNPAAEYAIKKHNPDLDEKNLKVGQVILIPEKKVKAPPAKN